MKIKNRIIKLLKGWKHNEKQDELWCYDEFVQKRKKCSGEKLNRLTEKAFQFALDMTTSAFYETALHLDVVFLNLLCEQHNIQVAW